MSLDISCELSAWQMIHMKCQDLFSSENKKKSKLSSALVVNDALRIKKYMYSERLFCQSKKFSSFNA